MIPPSARRAVAVAVLALGACTPTIQRNDWVPRPDYYSVARNGTRSTRYSRVTELTRYGESGLPAQADVAAAYERAQHLPAQDVPMVVFHGELPPGLTVEGRTIKVDERAPYAVIGGFEIDYLLEAAPQESDIGDDLLRLAAVTAADAVVVEIHHAAHADLRVAHLTGFILQNHARAAGLPRPAHAVLSKARLDYRATGPGCLSASEVADEVAARLGYVPWDDTAAATLHAAVTRAADGFHATLRVGSSNRRLAGGSCRIVLDALISVLVMDLDSPGAI